MDILNESLTVESLDDKIRHTFLGGQIVRMKLNSDRLLYKFTDRPLVNGGRVSPWWSAVEPITPGDTGLAGLLERAAALNVAPDTFSRARSAVTKQWNSMSGLLIVRLKISAYGFVGRCSAQLIDEEDSNMKNVVFIGGAWQVYLPNLLPQHVEQE